MLGCDALMDAAQALAELTEISSQVESAVLGTTDGTLVASTFADEARGTRVAAAAVELLETSEQEGRRGGLVQLQAVTYEASVFVVRDGDRFAAAVTAPDPTAGLVFYDLKTTLRQVAETPPEPAKATKQKKDGDGDKA